MLKITPLILTALLFLSGCQAPTAKVPVPLRDDMDDITRGLNSQSNLTSEVTPTPEQSNVKQGITIRFEGSQKVKTKYYFDFFGSAEPQAKQRNPQYCWGRWRGFLYLDNKVLYLDNCDIGSDFECDDTSIRSSWSDGLCIEASDLPANWRDYKIVYYWPTQERLDRDRTDYWSKLTLQEIANMPDIFIFSISNAE
jgi:hypothetical protein